MNNKELTNDEKKQLMLELFAKERFKNDPEIIKEINKNYYERNKEYYKNYRKTEKGKKAVIKANKRYLDKNPEFRLWYSAKQRAKKYDLEFLITKEDIVIPTRCPILDIEFAPGSGNAKSSKKDNSMSLDRIDPNLGYTKDNIQVISFLANRMKNSANKEMLLKFAGWIINNLQ